MFEFFMEKCMKYLISGLLSVCLLPGWAFAQHGHSGNHGHGSPGHHPGHSPGHNPGHHNPGHHNPGHNPGHHPGMHPGYHGHPGHGAHRMKNGHYCYGVRDFRYIGKRYCNRRHCWCYNCVNGGWFYWYAPNSCMMPLEDWSTYQPPTEDYVPIDEGTPVTIPE